MRLLECTMALPRLDVIHSSAELTDAQRNHAVVQTRYHRHCFQTMIPVGGIAAALEFLALRLPSPPLPIFAIAQLAVFIAPFWVFLRATRASRQEYLASQLELCGGLYDNQSTTPGV